MAGLRCAPSAYRLQDLRQAGSSGTTSTPIQFYRDIEALRNKSAIQMAVEFLVRIQPGRSVLMMWGAHRDLAMQPSWRWRLYEETSDAPHSRSQRNHQR